MRIPFLHPVFTLEGGNYLMHVVLTLVSVLLLLSIVLLLQRTTTATGIAENSHSTTRTLEAQ